MGETDEDALPATHARIADLTEPDLNGVACSPPDGDDDARPAQDEGSLEVSLNAGRLRFAHPFLPKRLAAHELGQAGVARERSPRQELEDAPLGPAPEPLVGAACAIRPPVIAGWAPARGRRSNAEVPAPTGRGGIEMASPTPTAPREWR